jgi:hypothetical protein
MMNEAYVPLVTDVDADRVKTGGGGGLGNKGDGNNIYNVWGIGVWGIRVREIK